MEAQLVQTLLATLSPASDTRLAGEQGLEQALNSPDAGTALARIVLADGVDLPVRQTAGVILKKFMDKWWDVLGEGLSQETKQLLLELLFQGLSLPSSKLRSQSAHSLSVALLTSDTSSLVLPHLLQILASPESSTDLVHGAMRVFQEAVRKGDLDLGGGVEGDERVMGVVRGLSPVLLGVLGNEAHSAATRASTIAVYRQCLSTTYMLKDTLPTLANATVEDVLPPWLSAFQVLLSQPSQPLNTSSGWETLKIHKEIFKTLDTIFRTFGRSFTSKIVTDLLPLTLNRLETLLPAFGLYYVSTTSDETPPTTEGGSDEEVTIEQVICPIIDFLTEVTRAGKLRSQWVGLGAKPKSTAKGGRSSLGGEVQEEGKETDELRRAISMVLNSTVLTTEDEDNWINDPNAFVADEDDEMDTYSLRIAGHDFISTLLEKYPKPAARVLQTVVKQTIDGARAQQGPSQPDWWKPLEASLALVGGVSEVLLETLEEEESQGLQQKSFDLGFIFDQVIPGFLAAKDFPFLHGRSFVVASQYATALAPSLASQYLDAAVQVLENSELGVSVKLSAVRTIKNFCRHLPLETVKPISHRILSNLVPLVLQAGDEVLALVLESLRSILGVDETALDGPLTGQLVDVMLQVWSNNARDPVISSIFEEIFEHLASTPVEESYNSLMSHALPKLCAAIDALQPQDPESSTIAAGAIEIIASILRGRKGPLDPNGQGFTAGIGGVIFPALINGDDMEVAQNGVEALILLICKDCESLLTSTIAATGESGLQSTFAVIARLLRPTESESRGLFLGDLVVHLLRNAGQAVAPVLPDLVKAIVERIPTATYSTFQQSLIVPLAYLIHTQFNEIVPLLESTSIVPPSSSTPISALEVLLKAWTENAMELQGSWAIRVSSLALGDLLASNRPSLENIRVRGEMIIDQANAQVIMTRSRTKTTPTTYTSTPFNVKALQLLVAEAGSAKLSGDYNASWEAGADEDEDEDDDDEDDGAEWEDDGPAFLKSGPKPADEFGFLSDMMGPGGIDDSFGDDLNDDALADDPISQLDMQAHLTTLLRTTYANHDGFGALAGQLSQDEMATLGSLLS